MPDPTNKFDKLAELLKDMDLPADRKNPFTDTDLRWLGTNMWVHNRHHPKFLQACNLLDQLQVRIILKG